VLKAIGLSDGLVMALVLAESLLIAAIGGGIGLLLARGLVARDITRGLLVMYLPPSALLAGVGVAAATGLVAALLPAFSAMRLNVVDAIRRF
jgi:putative ABC transport system permease protein